MVSVLEVGVVVVLELGMVVVLMWVFTSRRRFYCYVLMILCLAARKEKKKVGHLQGEPLLPWNEDLVGVVTSSQNQSCRLVLCRIFFFFNDWSVTSRHVL